MTFALWAVVLLGQFAAITALVGTPRPWTPQGEFGGYTSVELLGFGQLLVDRGAAESYRMLLVYADTVFVVLFGLWVVLSLRPRLWLGIALAVVYALFDLGENLQLAQHLSWTTGHTRLEGWVLYPPEDGPARLLVSWFTTAKLGAFVLLVAGILARDVIGWRRKA